LFKESGRFRASMVCQATASRKLLVGRWVLTLEVAVPFRHLCLGSWGSVGCQGLAQKSKRGQSTSLSQLSHMSPKGGNAAEADDAIQIRWTKACTIKTYKQEARRGWTRHPLICKS
jgi:hypothetical protein